MACCRSGSTDVVWQYLANAYDHNYDDDYTEHQLLCR
jgi:hypothetical protein